MSGTRAISTTSRCELSSSCFSCKARRRRKFTPLWQKHWFVYFLVGLRTYQLNIPEDFPVYIYIHIYIYIYTHMHTYLHINIHTHTYTYTYTHTHTQNLCCVAYIYLRNWEHISEIVPNSREEGRYKNSPTVRSFMRNLLVELRSSFLLWALHSENVEANKDNGYRIPTGSRYLWTN